MNTNLHKVNSLVY